jgi:phenylacetate-CoA ligase
MIAVEDLLHPFLNVYIHSPQWVKLSFGRLYSLLPKEIRQGREYKRFVANVEDPSSGAEIGMHKLRASLAWALTTVPALEQYRSLLDDLDRPLEVLSQLPLLSKEALRNNMPAYLSSGQPARRRLRTFTGGSTSIPLEFYLHRGVSRPKELVYMEQFHKRVGLADGCTVLALRGRTIPGAAGKVCRLWMFEPVKQQLMMSCDHLNREHLPEYIKAITKWKPAFIQAFPSALYPLARWLNEHPEPLLVGKIKGVMLYSESVYDHQMELFKRVFQCPVLKHYGHSERVLMAASMPDDDRYFFWPQYGHFELVGPDGCAITQPGIVGEIVGTGYDNMVLPFVRYRTGDLGVLGTVPHPALPGYPVVERIEGRLQEFIVCKDNRLISIATIGAAHFSSLAEVEEIQYEQWVPGQITIKAVLKRPMSSVTMNAIAVDLATKIQGGCSVEIVQVPSIPRTVSGKHKMLIQHIEISKIYGAMHKI